MAHHEPPASGGQDPEAEARFLRRILDSLDHPFYVVDVRDYTIRFANDATSCHGPLLPGRSTCYALTHNRDTPCTGDHPCPLEEVQWTGKPAVVEHTHYDHQGRPLPVEVHGHPIFDEEGNLAFMAEYSLDLSARKQLEADLRQVAQVFRHSGEGILIAGPDGRIQRVNPAFSRITGYSEEEVMGRTPGEVLGSGWQDRAFYRRFWQELRERGTWQGEIWNRRRSGEIYPEWLTASTVRDDQNGIQAYLGIFSDITQKKREESRLQRLAYYDPLTGLPNRATFKDRLEQAIARATRHDAALALLFVDLDGFKEVNDHWGHQAGDAVLQEVGHRLRSLVRKTDTVARLGGDEFTVLLEETDTCRADGVAEKVIIALNAPIPIGAGNSVTLGCSVGIVGCWMGEVLEAHAEHLLDYADQAMYQAKMAGKNTYRVYPEPGGEQGTPAPHGYLAEALDRGELELYFQPVVDLDPGRVTCLETLLRWNHPQRGLLPPEHFFTHIRPGLDDRLLTDWVLHTACTRMQARQEAGGDPLPVAVNLFPSDLQKPGPLLRSVREVLEDTGLEPRLLSLEIPEHALSRSPEPMRRCLEELCELGISLTIDDFGDGDSSLQTLHIPGIQRLKLSRAFLARALEAPSGDPEARLLETIHRVAETLGLAVVAKGLETREQWHILRARGYPCAQGFYLGAPQPARDLPMDLPLV